MASLALRDLALRKREMFARVVIGNLLTYAIGRGPRLPGHAAGPFALCATAAKDDYRFSSLLMGVIQSPAFTMNTKTVVQSPTLTMNTNKGD